MREEDAEQKAEKPERNRKVGGGTAEDTTSARQALTARGDKANDEASLLIEEVLRRENMMKAHKRVVANGGAPGVDGITVDELIAYCREHWSRIREEIRSGEYHPAPVRKVEIPKPGGKGTRMLGIPTVLDRMIQQALLQVLTPLFEPTFSKWSFGFRPGRSALGTVSWSRLHMIAGYRWVVDLEARTEKPQGILHYEPGRKHKDCRPEHNLDGILEAALDAPVDEQQRRREFERDRSTKQSGALACGLFANRTEATTSASTKQVHLPVQQLVLDYVTENRNDASEGENAKSARPPRTTAAAFTTYSRHTDESMNHRTATVRGGSSANGLMSVASNNG